MNDGNHSYIYDAENRIIKVDGGSTASYQYDAWGQRVRKTIPSYGYFDYIHGYSGEVLAEWTGSSGYTGWNHDYVYVLERGRPIITSYGRDGVPGGEGPDADITNRPDQKQ